MVNLEKVIFDTNRLYNKQASSFFSKNLCGLDKFSKVVEIIIPDIVLGELKYKYKREFEEEKEKFFKTILNSFLSHDAKSLDIDDRVEKLLINETINFSIIDLTDFSILKDMKELALKKEAPFKNGVKEDPGFKDTYIYFTILEYLKSIDDKYIFVCTEDIMLRKALERHSNIKVILDFDDFKEKSISVFYDNYFLSKLKDELGVEIDKDDILDYWININGNKVVRVYVCDTESETEFRVEVEQGEIISKIDEIEYVVRADGVDPVKGLINSGSYKNTHFMVEILMEYKNFLSNNEIIDILESIPKNSQIIPDEDVKQFINDIYQSQKDTISLDLKEKIEDFLKY